MIWQKEITLPPFRKGYHLVTKMITRALPELPDQGILHIFLKHTSAALILNENADPTVRDDFELFMNGLIPEMPGFYSHEDEGSDDMPAHLKSGLFGQSLTIPISHRQLNLGIWQGIYLCEFRNSGGSRSIVMTSTDKDFCRRVVVIRLTLIFGLF
jgi:secondary thiamine-phosphate synthase enzyme